MGLPLNMQSQSDSFLAASLQGKWTKRQNTYTHLCQQKLYALFEAFDEYD